MTMNKKVTSQKVATSASRSLTSGATGQNTKKAAASALSQTGAPKKQTGKAAASAASSVMRDGRTSPQSKSAAASALAQAKKRN